MAEQVQQFNFKFTNPRPDIVTMRSGRKGEWNEYVEFQAYNSAHIFVAQLCWPDCLTHVYDVTKGRRGTSKIVKLGFSVPVDAIDFAYNMALEQAQAG